MTKLFLVCLALLQTSIAAVRIPRGSRLRTHLDTLTQLPPSEIVDTSGDRNLREEAMVEDTETIGRVRQRVLPKAPKGVFTPTKPAPPAPALKVNATKVAGNVTKGANVTKAANVKVGDAPPPCRFINFYIKQNSFNASTDNRTYVYPFYNSTSNQILGYITTADSSQVGGDCVETSAYGFGFTANGTFLNRDVFYDQGTCNGKFFAITGGTQNNLCAMGQTAYLNTTNVNGTGMVEYYRTVLCYGCNPAKYNI